MTDSQGIDVLEQEKENQDQTSSEETDESASALSQKEYEDITDLVLLMDEHELAELEYEGENHRIRLKKQGADPEPGAASRAAAPAPAAQQTPASGTADAAGGQGTGSSGTEETAEREDSNLTTIKAPLVGTFYRAPAPDADPFVEEGDEIDEDTVVCIIEAMKVMNEIKAETSGTVERILVDNGEAVDFDEPLIEISPSD